MRNGCAIFVALFMTIALGGSAIAVYANRSVWTIMALLAISILHGLFWIGAGRAIYDVYIRTWKPVEKE